MMKNSVESIEGKGNIKIRSYKKRSSFYIEVSDNGSGMDKETLARMTEMFFTTKVKGSGLGVALSMEIIKAHDGSMKYFSKKGEGTKVVIELPVSKVDE